jgi:hypothetical protein
LFRQDRDSFASTLTSLDDAFSREVGAQRRAPRLTVLRLSGLSMAAGIFTWVSLEPTLDIESSLAIVQATHRFVDLYKVGRVNYLPMTKTTDWAELHPSDGGPAQSRGCQTLHQERPAALFAEGYPNPLRIQQHHGRAA